MTRSENWTHGYTVSEPYPAFWHPFQSPAHILTVCDMVGAVWEVGPETPLSIADVGCGSGYTAAIMAASSPHWQVLGLDYNPAHVAEARSMAAAAGLPNFQCREADLATLDGAALDALPDFDLVTVHGVWSWVADPVRAGILRLLQRKLKPGGIALITYNCLPAAAGAIGLARLARRVLTAAPSAEAGVAALSEQVRVLHAAEPENLPRTAWREMLLGTANREVRPGYLLHEFTTEHWRPAFHGDVAAALGTVGCSFVGSATLDENFPRMTLTQAQQALYATMPDDETRQLLIDFCIARAFRRDVYMRGLRRVSSDAGLRRIELMLGTHAGGPVTLRAGAGVAELPEAIVAEVRARLGAGPATVDELCSLPACAGLTAAELVTMVVATNVAARVWRRPGSGPDWDAAVASARRLNRVAAARLAPHGVGIGQKAIVSPVLGGGLPVDSLELAVSQIMAEEPPDPAMPAAVADRLLPPGYELPTEVRANLEAAIEEQLRDRGPVWRALGVV